MQYILLDDGTFAKFRDAYNSRIPMNEIMTYYNITCMENDEGKKLTKAQRKAEARKHGVRNYTALEDIFK